MVVFMNALDIETLGFEAAQFVDLTTANGDGVERVARGFEIVAYNIPRGCIGAYFPETNALVPLDHHDKQAHTPAYKAIPIRLNRSATTRHSRRELIGD
jgi:anaerobic selenocysteine-containing dehydrogenase